MKDWNKRKLRFQWTTKRGLQMQQLYSEVINTAAESGDAAASPETATTTAADRSRKSKTKHTCSSCGLNAWAKPTAHLVCGDCSQTMTPDEED